MEHPWQFTKMWQYFDYDTDAIYTYSEQIADFPDEQKEAVYQDIAGRMRNYILFLLPQPAVLNQFVGIIINDIYRTMNRAVRYTWKQQEYLNATAMVVINTLEEQGVSVHFGTSNSFGNAYGVKALFNAFWEDCGIRQIDVYNLAEKLAQRELSTHEELEEEYKKNKDEVLSVIRNAVGKFNEAGRSYALIIPFGTEEDFSVMTDTAGSPGYINVYKVQDAEDSKYVAFDYTPPTEA